MSDKKNNSGNVKNINFNVGGNHYGNNYQIDTMNITNSDRTKRFTQLSLHLQEMKNLVQDDIFPIQGKNELMPAIEEAQRNLNSSTPNRSFIDRVLEIANKYNAFFSGAQLVIAVGQIANDLFK